MGSRHGVKESLALLPRRVNRKSRWPLWRGSAAHLGRSAEPLCCVNGGETFPAFHDGEEIRSHPRAYRSGRKVSRILLLLFDLLLNPLQIFDQAVVIFHRLQGITLDELA